MATLDTSATTEPSSSSWLLWFAGGGIAIIFALLLFGGRLRQRFGSSPSSPGAAVAIGGARDADTGRLEALADDEYDLDDDSPTAENLALDADLIMGTGLEEGTDMEVAEDMMLVPPSGLRRIISTRPTVLYVARRHWRAGRRSPRKDARRQ